MSRRIDAANRARASTSQRGAGTVTRVIAAINAPYHDVAKKPQLASRGRVVAVLVWDAVILLRTKLAQVLRRPFEPARLLRSDHGSAIRAGRLAPTVLLSS